MYSWPPPNMNTKRMLGPTEQKVLRPRKEEIQKDLAIEHFRKKGNVKRDGFFEMGYTSFNTMCERIKGINFSKRGDEDAR